MSVLQRLMADERTVALPLSAEVCVGSKNCTSDASRIDERLRAAWVSRSVSRTDSPVSRTHIGACLDRSC